MQCEMAYNLSVIGSLCLGLKAKIFGFGLEISVLGLSLDALVLTVLNKDIFILFFLSVK